jgi:flagellar motility protein MotE (MotC chaperone)
MNRTPATAILLLVVLLALPGQTGRAAAPEEEPAPLKLPVETEPLFNSVEERRLAAILQEQRISLRQEREELALREKELKTLREGVDKKLAEIDGKLAEMKRLRQQLEELLAAKSAAEAKKVKELAGIYEKMTPVKAAPALAGLEPQLAADLLAAMKVKAAAKILDEISRQKATELSTTFSTLQLE